jgi:phosphotransferase system enzyme I (PtsI)
MHKGIAVSPGVVVGIAYRVDSVFGSGEPQMLADPGQVPAEIERFKRAVALAVAELEAIVTKVAQQLGSAEASIFQSHLQIVNDQTLLAKVHDLIEVQQLTALSALQLVLQGYAATFARIEHDYFRERIADVRDVISRIGSHLSVQSSPFPGTPKACPATMSRSSSSPMSSCPARR